MIDGRRVEYEPVLSSEPDSPQGHDQFPYARFPPAPHGNYVEPNYMGYSDYGGSTVERSNVQVFMEEFSDHQGTEWWELYGSHGTRAIVVRRDADERVPEMGEFFAALEQYPIANEELHSELEQEQRNEDWDSYGRADFIRWLRDDGPKELVVPFIRGVLAERYPALDSIFDQFKDETILEMVGGEEVWEKFVDALDTDPTDAIDRLWGDLMHRGSGAAEEIEGQNTSFRYDRAFTDYYEEGVKGASLEDLLYMTRESMQGGTAEDWRSLNDWAAALEHNGIGPTDRVQVLLDHLLARGEWDEGAEQILRAKRLGRYAA